MTRPQHASFFLVVFCVAAVLFACASSAGTIKTEFFQAENCSAELRQSPAKQKYRSYWLRCINQFLDVYEQNPSGKWAAATLFRAGQLYEALYQHSYRQADRREAEDLFRRIIKRFPQSAYCPKAKRQLDQIAPHKTATKKRSRANTRADSPDIAKQRYFAAEKCYRNLKDNPKKQKYRSFWKNCIKKFLAVHQADPDGPWAAAGLYMAGKLQTELYEHSYKKADRQEGARLFARIIRDFPDSAYRAKADRALQKIPDRQTTAKKEEKPALDDLFQQAEKSSGPAEAGTEADPGGKTLVQGLRYWSNPSYTRVVVDASQDTDFSHNLLRQDPTNGKPPRLYVDLNNSRLDQELSRQVRIDDNLLKDVRAGQFTPQSVRVVIDLKSFENYNVFSLQNPFRIVIDVRGESGQTADSGGQAPDGGDAATGTGAATASLAEQLSLKVRRIVIDPGHGGRDGGAPGWYKNVHEKKLVLKLAQKLAQRIRREIGCEVIITRQGDRFLTLEERTAIANTKNADLFLSIHTNACLSRKAYGIETYFLNLATDEDAMRVAARENSTSQKNISDLQKILNDLMQNAKINESSRLAGYVQSAMCENLESHYNRIKNKGVKQAPFYVLLGAQMPAILIETGFISNKQECRRLNNATYQDRLCEGIVKGIQAYINRTQSAAFIHSREG